MMPVSSRQTVGWSRPITHRQETLVFTHTDWPSDLDAFDNGTEPERLSSIAMASAGEVTTVVVVIGVILVSSHAIATFPNAAHKYSDRSLPGSAHSTSITSAVFQPRSYWYVLPSSPL